MSVRIRLARTILSGSSFYRTVHGERGATRSPVDACQRAHRFLSESVEYPKYLTVIGHRKHVEWLNPLQLV